MGALIGGSGTNTKNVIRYSSLQVSTSQLDIPITLFWGQRRIAPNVIWYNNFQSHKLNAGKGGSKGGQYTYSAAVILALGEGVMAPPVNVWGPSSTRTTTTLAKLGLGFMTGTASQAPWSYVATNWPDQALAYMDTAYVYSSNMGLGQSASVPDYGFELQRFNGFTNLLTAPGWTNPVTHGNTPGSDVSLADVIPDFLTSTIYGMGFSGADIDAASLAQFRAYQSAQGLYFSPHLSSQEKATSIIDRWAQVANSWIYWNGTAVQFVPLGDSAISANGFTYTPDLLAACNLGPADFIPEGKGGPPVEVTRKDPADCHNRTVLEICDRTRGYISSPVEYKDQQLVSTYGLRDASSTQANEICNPAVGAIAAQLIGKRAAYVRNTYKFRLGFRYIRLLPGSIVTLTEPHIGIANFPVRVRTIEEDDNGVLSLTAEELPAGIGTYFAQNTPPLLTATTTSTLIDPGPVNTPAVCEPASTFAQGSSVLLVAASGGVNWGGANVFLSLDGTDYSEIGVLTAPALQGTLTAALPAFTGTSPDTVDTLTVDATQSDGIFPSVGFANAQNATSLSWVAPQPVSSGGNEVLSGAGELLAFGAVAPTGAFTANLTYLYRGLYGTGAIAHAVGEEFTLLDASGHSGSTLVYDLPANTIGKTLYLKFQSFNVFGQAEEDMASLTTYAYVPGGAGFGSGALGVPGEPTGFGGIVQSSQVLLSWNANPAIDNVASYAVYRGNGTSTPFASCALVWAGQTTTFTDTNVNLVTGYTYYVVAANRVGDSLPSSGFNATTAGINNGQVLQSFGQFNATGLTEVACDFNAQVLACNVVEITVSRVVLQTAGASVVACLRAGGADITSGYAWQYAQSAYGASTPSSGGSASDTAVHLANQVSTSSGSDEVFGTVKLQIINGIYVKGTFEFTGTYNPSGNKCSEWVGSFEYASASTPITGMSLKASSGNIISATMTIRGYLA
jgi:hypothetical protein